MNKSSKWKPEYSWFTLFAVCTIGFSLVQDVIRPQYNGSHSGLIYMLGVLPNFFPAVGLPALFVIVLPYFSFGKSPPKWAPKKLHIMALIISATGLLGWEFLQLFTTNGYFDWHDIVWTLLGTGFFYLIWMGVSVSNKEE
jgi:glycopeptide antibiotics resistance protein